MSQQTLKRIHEETDFCYLGPHGYEENSPFLVKFMGSLFALLGEKGLSQLNQAKPQGKGKQPFNSGSAFLEMSARNPGNNERSC